MYAHVHGARSPDDLMYSSILFTGQRVGYVTVPKNVTDIRSFMGIMVYYRKFIEIFSKIAFPITSLHKKGKKFDWRKKCTKSFNKLKHLLTIAPILKNC